MTSSEGYDKSFRWVPRGTMRVLEVHNLRFGVHESFRRVRLTEGKTSDWSIFPGKPPMINQ